MFFTGQHSPRLDDKGRLFLPARYREQLTEVVMVVPGQEHCLQVWSTAGFEEATEGLARKSQTDRATRNYTRFLFANSSEEPVDKQGRITLNAGLRRYAGITDRDVLVVGVMDHAEIWNPTAWAQAQAGQEDVFANLDGQFGYVED